MPLVLSKLKKGKLRSLLFGSGYSIKARVLQGTLLGAVAVFSLTASVGDHLIDLWLVKEFDETLLAKASMLASLTLDTKEGPILRLADESMVEYLPGDAPEYFQLWHSGGTVMERSRSLFSGDLPRRKLDSNEPVFYDDLLPSGLVGRYVAMRFIPEPENPQLQAASRITSQRFLTVVVATPREELDEMLVIADSSVALGIFVVILLLVLVVRYVVHRGLLPLVRMQAQMADFDLHSESSRLSDDSLPIELQGVVKNFNDLMLRVQEGLERERQFSADVAHELRTPIAEIRSITDVALRWPNSLDSKEKILADIRDASIQMQAIVDNLLSLARSDRSDLNLQCEPVAVDEVLSGAVGKYQQEAHARRLSWQMDLQSGCLLWASAVEIELIISNLIENAVQYCPEGGAILVYCRSTQDQTTFSVSNPAPDLTLADTKLLFNRMWRKDNSRTSYTHFGLGLSLVEAYAKAMKLNLSASLSEHRTLTIQLSGATQAYQ